VKNFSFLKEISFSDPSYEVGALYTTFGADAIRYYYSSLNTPYSVHEMSFSSFVDKTLKTQLIPGGFNSDAYVVERIWATNSADNVKIPISIVYKKDLRKTDGSNPLLLYGYGSFGISVPTGFQKDVVSLLDRGFIYAIAHVRGGGYLGRSWYMDGKLMNKKHTFEDFIAVAEHLISSGYSTKGNIAAMGGSAGGTLVTTVANLRPDLFRAVLALVPFTEVVLSAINDSSPLAPFCWEEFGAPQEKSQYYYMKSYSPYENISSQRYPHVFVSGGLSDQRVEYWQPMKYISKLRYYNKAKDSLMLLRMNTEAGHFGALGRFDHLQDVSEQYVFLLRAFNLLKKK
jgi:oligopeptidase B